MDFFAGQSKSSVRFSFGSVRHQTIEEERKKIWAGIEKRFHVLFVFVTDSLVAKAPCALDVVIVDASNLDKFASPVTVVIRRVGSHAYDQKRPRNI